MRLFAQFAPEHYDIEINISADKRSFTGTTIIKGQRKGRPSRRLTFHQKGLSVKAMSLIHIDKKGQRTEVPVTRVVLQKSFDEVRLHTNELLRGGTFEVTLHFSGPITKNMDGVYPCFFKDNGVEKELIATQFESHHAREAFPCIDEPEAKATFQLTLTHPENEIALSNTLPIKTATNNKTTTTQFDRTPVMSTYLLAFIIGELSMKEITSKSGVSIRTFATKNQIEHTAFALEEAAKYMDFYESYYDIPFPLKKCDFVALPDFASGAMENWGLITFREQTLLVDPDTSLGTKQFVALVIAHELTHQWFGNLVTMRWWTDLWLNEGFASWMEYLAVDSFHPEWHLWTQFAVNEQQLALKMDALEHTHPIEVEVKHPDEIRTIFDTISYQKGASAIHMLHDYLGNEGFKKGLRYYLKSHEYKNTDTVDLWQALEDVTKKPVKEFMHAWTSQSGFPLLTVEKKDDHLKITQTRFVANPASSSRKDPTLWPVPLLAPGLAHPTIHKKSTSVHHSHDRTIPIKLNRGQTGFYRVDYSHDIQTTQIESIRQGEMDVLDRMGLLSDGFEITKAGYQPISEYLDLIDSFRAEDSLPVWEILAGSFGSIRSVLSESDNDNNLRDLMKPFIQNYVHLQLSRLGFQERDNESHLDTLLRPLIVSLAALSDDEETLAEIALLYRKKIDHKAAINPDLRAIVYATAARLGGKKEFDELWSLYEQTQSSDEKLSIAAAMTSFVQPELHTAVLNLLKAEKVKFQDVPYWIAYSLANRHSKLETWKWLQKNWLWMKKNMGTDLSFSRFPVYVARTVAEDNLLDEYQTFFTAHMEPIIARAYAQGLEIIQTNVSWRKRDAQAAAMWFSDQIAQD